MELGWEVCGKGGGFKVGWLRLKWWYKMEGYRDTRGFSIPTQGFLNGKAKELLGNYNFLLSISHDEDLVIAVCVALYQGT
jgi:hypothetical protein